jgi:CRP-like cAMP-binding protein
MGVLRDSDVASFRAALEGLDEDDVQAALPLLSVRELVRGEHVLNAGDDAASVMFVVEGVLREYFLLEDGTERTKAFVVDGQISGSLADLLSGEPSRAFIVAEEPTRVLLAPYRDLTALGRHREGWVRFGRRATEGLLLWKAQREYELLALDADGRYAAFRERYGELEARVAAKHVASYLGITPVHLSRLRRRRAGRAKR